MHKARWMAKILYSIKISETPHFRYIAIFRYRREVTSETSAFVCQAGIFRFLLDIKVSFRPRFQLSTGRDFRLFAILVVLSSLVF